MEFGEKDPSELLIVSIVSPEGERVPLKTIIDPKNKNVEAWLLEVGSSYRF